MQQLDPPVDLIRDRVTAHEPRLATSARQQWQAATALTLAPDEGGQTNLLLIRRARRDGDPWSGHVALPGGRFDQADGDLSMTARRETREEVGIDLGDPIGRLDDIGGRRFHGTVATFVFELDRPVEPTPDLTEVQRAFWVPLRDLFDQQRAFRYHYRRQRLPLFMRAFRFSAVDVDGEVLWGLTWQTLQNFAGILDTSLPRASLLSRSLRRAPSHPRAR